MYILPGVSGVSRFIITPRLSVAERGTTMSWQLASDNPSLSFRRCHPTDPRTSESANIRAVWWSLWAVVLSSPRPLHVNSRQIYNGASVNITINVSPDQRRLVKLDGDRMEILLDAILSSVLFCLVWRIVGMLWKDMTENMRHNLKVL